MADPYPLFVCLLLLLCLVLGGGGTTNPASEVALESLVAVLLLGWLWRPRSWRMPGRNAGGAAYTLRAPRLALLLAALVVMIPVVQLIPLPPALWHALPGRATEVESLALVGQSQQWMPLTMTPAATFASLLAIVLEVALFLLIVRLNLGSRMWACLAIGIVGIASVLLGGLQLSQAGGYTWSIYAEANIGWLLGFHANRNATTDTLQIAMMAIASCVAIGTGRGKMAVAWIGVGIFLMIALGIGTVLTGSRSGMVLLPLTCLFVLSILWPLLPRRMNWRILAGLSVAAVLALGILGSTGPVQQAMARFAIDDEHRWDIWHDTSRAISTVWPWGSGIGSFRVVFASAQSLERMFPAIDLRAHNDWLEWTLEAGVPGLLALGAIGFCMMIGAGRALFAALRRDADPMLRAQVLFAIGSLLHIALHAILDYPIRSMALAALVATAAALLMPAAAQEEIVPN